MKKLVSIMLVFLLLFPLSAAASGYAPRSLTDAETAAASLFLSNFTETGVRACDTSSGDMVLVDFAHDHLWFNANASYEFGEYDGDNNCRVSDVRIQQIIDKYFYEPYPVDLTATRFDYADGYYYHCETGGWTSCGFARAVSLCPVGEDRYFISFLIFGGGEHWDNGVMDDSLEEIESAFGAPTGFGSALIHAEDLTDRSTYKMISYSRL